MLESHSNQKLLNWLYWIGFISTMFAVGLQMSGVHGGFITNYLADIGGPIWFYSIVRQRKVLFKKLLPNTTPLFSFIFVFLVGTGWEIMQAFDFSGTILAITRGRFDPFDILCYAFTLAACFLVDQKLSARFNTTTAKF